MATTYSSLRTLIQEFAENDAAEFTDRLDDFIELGARRLFYALDEFGLVRYAQTTAAAADPFITKPTGSTIVKSLSYTDGGSRTNLRLKTDEFIAEYWPDRTSIGTPKYYAPWGYDKLIVAPAFTSTNLVEMSYVVMPATLSTAATTNWFTDFTPQALLYSCLVEAMLFEKNYEAAKIWEERMNGEVERHINNARRMRRDDAMWNLSPQGGENNQMKDST